MNYYQMTESLGKFICGVFYKNVSVVLLFYLKHDYNKQFKHLTTFK